MARRSLLSTFLLLLFSLAAAAAPLRPNSGLWWEEPVTGRFYAVEIAPSGMTYVVISEFDEHGKPVWHSMRGRLLVSSEQEQVAGAPLASLQAPLLELDGACPTCPVSSPNVRPIPGPEARIEFRTHAEAEFQYGAIRRPLRYFAPADQTSDFPSARLAGEYALAYGDGGDLLTREMVLEPAHDAACGRYVGTPPPANATRLRGNCVTGLTGFCENIGTGAFAANLELAVGAGEHPVISAYQRTLAPRESFPAVCTIQLVGGVLSNDCRCPSGFSLGGGFSLGSGVCVSNDAATVVCTESHRISEQAGVIRGLPLRSADRPFVLYPTRDL
jgi:hypothetical protein